RWQDSADFADRRRPPNKHRSFRVRAQLTVGDVPTRIRAKRNQKPTADIKPTEMVSAAAHQSAQLPGFAPLLEELEVAGWSSHRRALSGNFHDWMLLQQRTLLVMAGHATSAESI